MVQSSLVGLHTAPAVLHSPHPVQHSVPGHLCLVTQYPSLFGAMDTSGFYSETPHLSIVHTTGGTQDLPTLAGPLSSTDLKHEVPSEQEEGCPVCGDRVSGYHYGLLTCESCKGFFKRSVQNNKHYSCTERQSCPMDPAQRKRCPYCRFQKCLAVGMKKEAVRADRMRGGRNKFGPLYRRARQLKQQRGGYHQENTIPNRTQLETSQAHFPALQHDIHSLPSTYPAAFGPEIFHQSQTFPISINQSEIPVVLDRTYSRDRALIPSPLPYTGLYHPSSFHGYPQKKEELSFNPYPAAPCTISTVLKHTSTHILASPPAPTMSPAPSMTPSTTVTSDLPSSSACFLSELLQGEPDESQICARVVASLRREQASRGKHDRLNTFSIMCKMADQTLFGLVEWARNCTLFKELKVEDQMALLQSCWSELLVLDHLCRQVHYGIDGCIYLVTGQQIEVSTVLSQAGTVLSSLVSRAQDLVLKLRTLQLDRKEFVCLKYLVLFNPGIRTHNPDTALQIQKSISTNVASGSNLTTHCTTQPQNLSTRIRTQDVKAVQDRRQVEFTQERVNRALMEHTMHTHAGQSDKFGQLLLRLPEVRSISLQVEEYLYQRHLLGDLPCNSLLTEMLHAKHT